MIVWQIINIAILLAIGGIILYVRRKAKGSLSLYKLTLLLAGFALYFISTQTHILNFDKELLDNFAVFLLVTLTFELSIRINPENIHMNSKTLGVFVWTLIINIVIMGLLASYLINIPTMQAIIFALILTTIEYFMVEELRKEGDFANPLIIIFALSIVYFMTLNNQLFYNIGDFLRYMLIVIATGVISGIIVFKLMNNAKISWVHELALLCTAVVVYIFTILLGGSGIFSIIILGVFFGNSYVRKKNDMKSFSPFIFKSLEILLFLIIGFMIPFNLKFFLWALLIFIIYCIIRYIIISIYHKTYSMQNKLLLTFAPKGMVYAALLLVFSIEFFSVSLSSMMAWILIISLLIASGIEFVEGKKIKRLEELYVVLKNIRYGRKRDLKHK